MEEVPLKMATQANIARDTLPFLRQVGRPGVQGGKRKMVSSKSHAVWSDAIRSTVALWMFVLLVFMPRIIQRHVGDPWTSILLDCITVLISIGLALVMFLASRATIGLPYWTRLPLRAAAVLFFASLNMVIDLLYQGWIADNIDQTWSNLPTDFSRAYNSLLNYILVFGVNMILFHVSYARRAAVQQERQLAEAQLSAQQAQLAALRYQLNPHFLFNALNSISALIVTKRNEDAEEMTEKLSSFLRSSLNAEPSELIPLDDELALTEEYLDIESVRFGDRLGIDNLRHRLQAVFGKRASLAAGPVGNRFVATISIPNVTIAA